MESVSISDQISENNNQESSHDTPSSNIIQEDGIIHTEHPTDNENDANSNSLNTDGRKDKVSQKKKTSIKPKDESPSSVALVGKNENKVDDSFKDDTSRRTSDLKKLMDISRASVIHPILSP